MNMPTARKLGLLMIQGALLACLVVPSVTLAADTPAPAQTTPQPADTTSTGFVPLTHFPQIQSLAQSQGFGDFVNTLYKICIGAGAVLAVIMIMVAGVQFMTSRGSVSSNEKAKSHIQNALLGLLLVLAPTIVFGIINPEILHLNLGNEFTQLKQKDIQQGAFATPWTTPSGTQAYLLAEYVVYTNNSTNASCYASLVNSYTTQAACDSTKNSAPAAFGQKDGWTQGTVTVVKSCELGDPSSFSLSVPNNVPRCTN